MSQTESSSTRVVAVNDVQAILQDEVSTLTLVEDKHMRQVIHNLLTSVSAKVDALAATAI